MILVEGKGEVSGDVIKILVDEILPMDAVREKYAKKIFFLLNADEVTDITISRLKELMEKNKGNCICYFNVVGREFEKQQVFISRKFSINPTSEFIEGVQDILGKHAIKLS
jgi:DNA polymerase-3 subunit alpha